MFRAKRVGNFFQSLGRTSWRANFKTFQYRPPNPSPKPSSPPYVGALSLTFNSFRYRSNLLLSIPVTTVAHAQGKYSDVVGVLPNLEQYEKINAEALLVGKKRSLWMRIRMLARVLYLLSIFAPAAVTMPFLVIFGPSSRWVQWWWSLLRLSLESAGACWIKFGQWASTRPDLFPDEMCNQLAQLHSDCPSHPGSFSVKTICKELKCNLRDLFLYFDPIPIASGSIGQVHKGVLTNGRVVAVKVLHPHALKTISMDFRIMYGLAKVANLLPGFKWLSLPEGVLEFGKSMILQLDLRREAGNLVRFHDNFQGSESVTFPVPLFARRSVLIETFEPGEPISGLLHTHSPKNKKIAKIGCNTFLKMMLVDNFTHSDLHPGNILVRETNNGKDFQLVLLDVGLVTQLSPRDKENFLKLFEAVVKGDGRLGADLMIQQATEKQCTGEQQEHFKKEMEKIFSYLRDRPLSEVRVGVVLNDVLTAVRRHNVKIESNFATLVMGTVVLEGLGKQLDPTLNLIDEAFPYFVKEKFSFSRIWNYFFGQPDAVAA